MSRRPLQHSLRQPPQARPQPPLLPRTLTIRLTPTYRASPHLCPPIIPSPRLTCRTPPHTRRHHAHPHHRTGQPISRHVGRRLHAAHDAIIGGQQSQPPPPPSVTIVFSRLAILAPPPLRPAFDEGSATNQSQTTRTVMLQEAPWTRAVEQALHPPWTPTTQQ